METQLVAIMLTDISGYTEFSAQADRAAVEAAVHQQQAIIQPMIDEFHGRLVKWIGDAALAVFGSATDAVLCGRKIQSSFVENAERGSTTIGARVKVVVHAGEVNVDRDGDIYGDPVNVTARMEKASQPDEVYFSEIVRRVISRAEIPHEYVGEFEFKGLPEKTLVYRTCFGQTPVVRERIVLTQTNFVGIQGLADRHGWDAVHPMLDQLTGAIVEGARRRGGTNRGVMQNGCFMTFSHVRDALLAVGDWHGALQSLPTGSLGQGELKFRVGVHWGTLHVMKYTMMGRDIDIVRTMAALGFGNEALLTAEAHQAARAEGLPGDLFTTVATAHLRECASRSRWTVKFADMPVYRLDAKDFVKL